MEMVMVGNPVMHHLVHGINPVELIGHFRWQSMTIITLLLNWIFSFINCPTYTLPCIAGHVGADDAMVLAELRIIRKQSSAGGCWDQSEIVLGNRDVFAASSPTGPAFEGAQISSGQRAAPGAVERVRIDPKTNRASVSSGPNAGLMMSPLQKKQKRPE